MLLNKQAYRIQLSGLKQLRKVKVARMIKQQLKLNNLPATATEKERWHQADKVVMASKEANKTKRKLLALDFAKSFVSGEYRTKISLNKVYPMVHLITNSTDRILGFNYQHNDLSWILLCLKARTNLALVDSSRQYLFTKILATAEEYLQTEMLDSWKDIAVTIWMNASNTKQYKND